MSELVKADLARELDIAQSTAEPQSYVPGAREYDGSLVEQFVALELLKQQGWSAHSFDPFHFRDQTAGRLPARRRLRLKGRERRAEMSR